jgi:hypothetical protein
VATLWFKVRLGGASSFLEVNVRNVARIKLGYYPLPQQAGKRLRRLLDFSAGSASVVDPCVGTGAALHPCSRITKI